MGNDNLVVSKIKEICGFQERVRGSVVMKELAVVVSNFLLRSPGKLHNWSQRCLRTRGWFGDGLRRWVLHILSFCLCLVVMNLRHLQLTLDRPWNVNAFQKPLSGLKNVPRSLTKNFNGFGRGFTDLHAKFNTNTLLDFVIHRRQNERKVKESLI
jgi:hypothetical protein